MTTKMTTYTLTISAAQRDKIVIALQQAFPLDLPDDSAGLETTSAADLVLMLNDMDPDPEVTNDFLA